MKKFYLAIGSFILLMNACTYPPNVLRMIPPESEGKSYRNSNKSINLEMVGGGKTTNIFRTSCIDNESFYRAIEQSLIKSDLFSEVNSLVMADYILKTTIISQEKPFALINVTVKFLVLYRLINPADGSEIWCNTILSECKKTLGDEFMGGKREQKAYECAAQKNIHQLIEELAQLYL
jgi:hypothetical protein